MKERDANPIVGDVPEQRISMAESRTVNASERLGRAFEQIQPASDRRVLCKPADQRRSGVSDEEVVLGDREQPRRRKAGDPPLDYPVGFVAQCSAGTEFRAGSEPCEHFCDAVDGPARLGCEFQPRDRPVVDVGREDGVDSRAGMTDSFAPPSKLTCSGPRPGGICDAETPRRQQPADKGFGGMHGYR